MKIKIVIGVVAILVLMIGTPLGVWASFRPWPAVSEDGKPCAYGPNHDICLSGYLESIPGTQNAIDHAAGFKVGYYDFIHEGIYHHLKAEDNAPSISWGNGYFDGWGAACIKAGNSDDQCGSWEDYSTP